MSFVRRVLTCVLSVSSVVSVAAESQTDEAAIVFDGVKASEMRGGTWKVVYSSAEGPEGRALAVLTERLGPILLREGFISTSMVLPLERDGGEPVKGKRDAIIVGSISENAQLRKYVNAGDVPKGGYFIRTLNDGGRNIVAIAGDGPSETLWGVCDFLDTVVPTLEGKIRHTPSARYPGLLFRSDAIPESAYATAPQTPVRSVFSWGHVQDDYEETFKAMAAARFNRAILWNDQFVVNAKDVVACAHDWGVKVYWGFSWGWTLSGKDGPVDFEKLADEVVSEWRAKWKPMGGDGIYFQSFTETEKKTIGGKNIPEAVVTFVNAVTKRIRAENPDLDIVFGLHSNSMRYPGAEEALRQVDPTLEILWENCGGFPYWEAHGEVVKPDVEFNDRILALTGKVGLAWKAQLRIDWSHFVSPAGPFLLGRAGRRVLDRDRAVVAPQQAAYDEDWILNGKAAWELVRHIRSGKHLPCEFNAVAEYNPPYAYSTLVQAELFWNSDDSWDEISKRARMRMRAGRD